MCKITAAKYADDTKIGRVENNDEDMIITKSNLDHLISQAHSYQMHFNAAKYSVRRVGTRIAGCT